MSSTFSLQKLGYTVLPNDFLAFFARQVDNSSVDLVNLEEVSLLWRKHHFERLLQKHAEGSDGLNLLTLGRKSNVLFVSHSPLSSFLNGFDSLENSLPWTDRLRSSVKTSLVLCDCPETVSIRR